MTDTGNAGQAAGQHAVSFAGVLEEETRLHDGRFHAAAAVRHGERVLDVGCGTGWATRRAARQAGAAGYAVGIDLSLPALAHATRLAAERNVPNAWFVAADAQRAVFAPETFDLVVSSFGTMFFADPVTAFTRLAAALRPGGRLAMIVWQSRANNEWTGSVRDAVLGPGFQDDEDDEPDERQTPFSLGDPDVVRGTLGAAGFTGIGLEDVHEPVRYGPDPDTAYRFILGLRVTHALLDDFDPAARAAAEDRIRAMVDSHATDDGVWFDGRTWVVTAHR